MKEKEFKEGMVKVFQNLEKYNHVNSGVCQAIKRGFLKHYKPGFEGIINLLFQELYNPEDKGWYWLSVYDDKGIYLERESYQNRLDKLKDFEKRVLADKTYLKW